jgi:hypothetical protein
VRETLGEDTCDARRSVSDPGTPGVQAGRPPRPGPAGPCSFDKGLSSTYPSFKYRVRKRGTQTSWVVVATARRRDGDAASCATSV